MKLVVDEDLCEANGICVQRAPDVFDLDDDDRLHLRVTQSTDTKTRERIEAAIAGCPRAALSWSDN
ncbi:MAG: ferredoxin [Myxococcota bacterium]